MAKQQRLTGGKKGKRSARNKMSGKYVRQFERTEKNLKRKNKTNKKVRGR